MSKKFSFSTTLVALLGLMLGSAHAATVNFYENFNDGVAADFVFGPAVNHWLLTGGAMTNVGQTNFTASYATVPLTNAAGKDILISTTFNASAFDVNSDAGFYAFSDSALGLGADGYIADFKPDGTMRILEGASGYGTDLSTTGSGTNSGPFAFALDTTYTLTLLLTPNGLDHDLTFSVFDSGGGLLATATGTTTGTAAAGTNFGYRARRAGAQVVAVYDNFSVIDPNNPGSPGDFDGDGDVDGADFLQWQRDGLSAADLTLWEADFGFDSGTLSASVGTVPEPSAFLRLLGGLILAVLLPRRLTTIAV